MDETIDSMTLIDAMVPWAEVGSFALELLAAIVVPVILWLRSRAEANALTANAYREEARLHENARGQACAIAEGQRMCPKALNHKANAKCPSGCLPYMGRSHGASSSRLFPSA